MRISGLSSGLDVEQIIEDLMRVERIPVDRVFQQKVKAEWKRDAYRDANMKLLRLRNMSFDLGLQGTFEKKAAVSSRESTVSAVATGKAREGAFQVTVNQLAEAAQLVAKDAGQNLSAFFTDGMEEAGFSLLGLDGEWVEITVSAGDSLENIAAQIRGNKNLGINVFQEGGQISLTTGASGAGAKIQVQDNDGFFAAVFGAVDEGGVAAAGKDAEITVNGIEVRRGSNTFDLNGIVLTLHEVSEQPVQIDIRHDVDAVVEKIKEFVDLYNEIVEEFNAALREDVHRDFPPLTDAQKAEMTDKEIEMWEEKARSGLLRSDRLIGNVLAEMRLALGGAVEDLDGARTLTEIGIKTGAWFEHGRLYVDEEKLRSAVAEHPGQVRDLFTNSSEEQPGLAKRLTAALDVGMQRITSTAGKASSIYDQSFLGEEIRGYEKRLAALEDRLIQIEQNHWNKFTAMEKVLSQLYAQSDWLFQQLLSMQG